MPEHLRRFGRVSESVSSLNSEDSEDFDSIDDPESVLPSVDSEELEDDDDDVEGSRRRFRLTGFFFLTSTYFLCLELLSSGFCPLSRRL